MSWRRFKNLFKKKKKYDAPVIDFTHPDLNGMKIHTKQVGFKLYEVNGVVLPAEDMIEAQRKYLRQKK